MNSDSECWDVLFPSSKLPFSPIIYSDMFSNDVEETGKLKEILGNCLENSGTEIMAEKLKHNRRNVIKRQELFFLSMRVK